MKVWTTLSSCFLLSLSVVANADSPVWKITKGGQTVYVGGTVHVLGEADFPLPEEFEQAYKQSAILVFEMDMAKTKSPEFQQVMLQHMTYQDGRTYADVLKPDTVTKLNTYMQQQGLPVSQLQVFKPSMLSVTLTLVELQRLGIGGKGVDEHYRNQGTSDKKSFLFLETPEQQIAYLAQMGEGYEDEFVNYTLNDLPNLGPMMAKLKAAWRVGDNKTLYDVTAKDQAENFPQFYQQLITERNTNWIPQIENYFKTNDVEFVLVGAMHLVGEEGVLKLLENKGYKIKQL